jgi:hypothetical protein
MARVPLTGGTYQARSDIANYQTCINLFPENTPQADQPPTPVSHFRTPGLTLLGTPPAAVAGRGIWLASNGQFYCVVGNNVYVVSSTYGYTLLGTLTGSFPPVVTTSTHFEIGVVEIVVTNAKNIVLGMNVSGSGIAAGTTVTGATGGTTIGISTATLGERDNVTLTFTLPTTPAAYTDTTTTPVSMTDNGLQLVIVNGSAYGWYITLADNTFSSIYDTAFLGSTLVDFVDTYFVFNEPGTPTFYCSLSLAVNFDPLYFADKEGFSDYLLGVIVNRREVWLVGAKTMENWYNAGSADFPFSIMPGSFVQHGTVYAYSLTKIDASMFFLTRDLQGQAMVFMAENYSAQRVSNHGVEYLWSQYAVLDAVGWTYNLGGHSFYVLNFQTQDVTWVYDLATGQWHQWSSDLPSGTTHRHRGQAQVQAFGTNVVIDWQNGNLYKLDLTNATENGNTVTRRRSFPHIVGGGNREIHWEVICDVDTSGLTSGTAVLNLRWSDDRGQTWIESDVMNINPSAGQWQQAWLTQLGQTRDRIYEFFWTDPSISSIQGMFLTRENCE